MIRLFATALSPRNLLFSLGADYFAIYRLGSCRTENNFQYFSGPALPTDATPRAHSVLGGPSPRREDAPGFRRTFEAQGLRGQILNSPGQLTRNLIARAKPAQCS